MEENQPSKKIFITFDDGPNEPHTPQILDILKEFGAKATFFVCGKNIEKFPQIAKRIADEGHTIGNHTYSHSKTLNFTGFFVKKFIKEIEETEKIIWNAAGIKTKFFRPPWGILMPWMKTCLLDRGYRIILWDIEAHDWEEPPSEIIARRILGKVKPNDIILLHDGEKTKLRTNRSQTVLSLPLVIKSLKDKGYQFRAL